LKYDDVRFEPPAPVVDIRIKNHWIPELEESWYALIDSGSDVTAIPKQFLNKLKLKPYTSVEIEGATHNPNKKEYRDKVFVDLELVDFNIIIPLKSVVLLDITEALIGRDILNQLKIELDGPNKSFKFIK
jgi:predicted aspartyl protease